MSQPNVRSTTRAFFEQNKALSLFWSQNHLYNPTAKIHHPLHERFSVKATVNPDSCQARYFLIGLFDPFENLFPP
jgi:hypothetical protein